MMQRRTAMRGVPMLLAAMTLGLAACSRPIYNTAGGSFTGSGTPAVRLAQIERAAGGLGWQVDPVRPGVARATLNLRGHVAVTEIAYDATRFTIRYVDSRNLGFDGTNIHKNYNGWIENLERAISQQPVP